MRRARDEEVAALIVPRESLARALDDVDDYEVLRRVSTIDRREPRYRITGEITIGVLDVETTGTDRAKDSVIEFAIQQITIDGEGCIVEASRPYGWLEDPGFPIPPEITAKTGIGDADVKGRSISEGEAYALLKSSDVLLAHNAGFDRPFVERRFEVLGKAWICSLRDIDWTLHGFECHKLGCLTRRSGWFHAPHRAVDDVGALVRVLDQQLPNGNTVLRELFRNAMKPSFLVEAPGTPFGMNDALRGRGYAWDPDRKLRWRSVPEDAIDEEVAWLVNKVYAGKREPVVVKQTWRERYALREGSAA